LSLEGMRRLASRGALTRLGARGDRPVVLTAGYPLEGRPTNLVTVLESARISSGR
jgi:hypothetical protein